MLRRPVQPYPQDVWLNVKLDGIPAAKRRDVTDQLQRISGWNSSLTGDDGGGLRYRYRQGRETSIPSRAKRIVRQAGGSESNVTSFILWRMDVDFRQILDVNVFAPMTQVMRSLPGVLNTHARGEGLTLAGVRIEFRGEPSATLLERIRRLVAPHMAA